MLRTNNEYVELAYYEGEWVYVPMFYVSLEAIGEDGYLHHYQLKLIDEKESLESPPRRYIDHAYRIIKSKIKRTILPWMLPKKDLKELCMKYNIPILWTTGIQRTISTKNEINRSTRRNNRKCSPINKDGYEKFIKKLLKIDKQSYIIAKVLWHFNDILQAGDDYVTLDEVLRLRVEDVDPENGLTYRIRLTRQTMSGIHDVLFWIPKRIWDPLCSLISQDSIFVFCNKNCSLLNSGDVNRHFKKAGELAGIKTSVSSLSLRPIGMLNSKKNHFLSEDITQKKWEEICMNIPGLISNRGTPPKYDPRLIFNGYLHHVRTGISFRKLPDEYPPGRVIHSQISRWKKKGLFELIFDFIK